MTTKRKNPAALADLPNIGPEVARLLVAAGISSPAQLKKLGSVAAAIRIAQIRPTDPPCRSMLAGLQGAIQNTRWHNLPKAQRDALYEQYQGRLNALPHKKCASISQNAGGSSK